VYLFCPSLPSSSPSVRPPLSSARRSIKKITPSASPPPSSQSRSDCLPMRLWRGSNVLLHTSYKEHCYDTEHIGQQRQSHTYSRDLRLQWQLSSHFVFASELKGGRHTKFRGKSSHFGACRKTVCPANGFRYLSLYAKLMVGDVTPTSRGIASRPFGKDPDLCLAREIIHHPSWMFEAWKKGQ